MSGAPPNSSGGARCKYVDPQTGTRCPVRLETAGEWGCAAHILQAPPEVLQMALAIREARREKKRLAAEAARRRAVLPYTLSIAHPSAQTHLTYAPQPHRLNVG